MDLSMANKIPSVDNYNSVECEKNMELELSMSRENDVVENEKDDELSNCDNSAILDEASNGDNASVLDQSGDSNNDPGNGLRRSNRQRQNAIKKREIKKENDKKLEELTISAKLSPDSSIKKRKNSTPSINQSIIMSNNVSEPVSKFLPAFDIKGSLLVLAAKLRQAELTVLKRQSGPCPPPPSASRPACGVSLCLESGKYRFIAPLSRKRYIEAAVAAANVPAKRHCASDVSVPGRGSAQYKIELKYHQTKQERSSDENLTELEQSVCEGVGVLKELSRAVKYISIPPARPSALILPRRTQLGPSMWTFFSDQSHIEEENPETVTVDPLCSFFDKNKDHYRALNNSYRQRLGDYVGELSSETMEAIVGAAVCLTVASKRKEFQESIKTALKDLNIAVPASEIISLDESESSSKVGPAGGFDSTSLNLFDVKASNSYKSNEINKSFAMNLNSTSQSVKGIQNGLKIGNTFAALNTTEMTSYSEGQDSDTGDLFQNTVKSSSRAKYECELCPYNTDSKSHLFRHKRSIHVVHRPYACYVCLKPFSRTDNVRSHFRSAHPRMIFRHELVRKIGIGEVFKRGAGFSYVRDGSETSELNASGDASMGGFDSQSSSLDGRSSRYNENYTGHIDVRDEPMDMCLNLSTKKVMDDCSSAKKEKYKSSELASVWRQAFASHTSAADSLRSISEQVRNDVRLKNNSVNTWNGNKAPDLRKSVGMNSQGTSTQKHSLGGNKIMHSAKHAKVKPVKQLPCMICNESFTSLHLLETHVKIVHQQRLYICPHHPACAHYTVGAREYLRHLAVAHMDSRIDVAAVSNAGGNNLHNGLIEKSVDGSSSKSTNSHSVSMLDIPTPSTLAVLGLERKDSIRSKSAHALSETIGHPFLNSHSASITEFLSDNTRSLIEAVSQNQKQKAAQRGHNEQQPSVQQPSVPTSIVVKVPPKPRGDKVFRCPFCPGKSPFCYRKSYDKHMQKHETGARKIRRPLEPSIE